jgi:hypothetical protein
VAPDSRQGGSVLVNGWVGGCRQLGRAAAWPTGLAPAGCQPRGLILGASALGRGLVWRLEQGWGLWTPLSCSPPTLCPSTHTHSCCSRTMPRPELVKWLDKSVKVVLAAVRKGSIPAIEVQDLVLQVGSAVAAAAAAAALSVWHQRVPRTPLLMSPHQCPRRPGRALPGADLQALQCCLHWTQLDTSACSALLQAALWPPCPLHSPP